MATHTRVHTTVDFANPYLTCDHCGHHVTGWHDDTACGCPDTFWNTPCECPRAGVTSLCQTWTPVGGCTCPAAFGSTPHPQRP